MGRTKEFDPATALAAAMDLFWRKGYEATSMQDLVDHLGIGRASIYATFGSKHELYLKALQHYRNDFDVTARQLSQPGSAIAAIRTLVHYIVEDKLADADRKGCFAVNAAGECLPGDEQLTRQVEAAWGTMETLLTSALYRAQAQGELAAHKNPQELGRFLFTVIEGLMVLAKAPDPQRLRDAARVALSVLD
ncbi:TetR/AcrR family transcriptional regulator [Streptomyces chartreusis]|uniref:Helix-turn-helix transcriptional regulator n=1 Tax=Streptomyces chartreusis TaxID=1969 RepID=A0A7H8T065_STRCX|nr:TetR/AcrR family transcriptional regulator [Streptomyces chartreusis]QKZ16111.1 helix-turn-helix transcriptional regulator [Streptomyces chartreusis]QKZ16906.1 helix-turn-helix transcriptional regulator [Streptomyces chartreusis]